MKNTFVVIGFIVCALASFGLMQLSKSIMLSQQGPWSQGEPHMKHIEAASLSMIDKCKLDRMQGTLKGYKDSMECSNPTMREAFLKEGFKDMGKVDEYLAQRVIYAGKLDAGEITEDDMRQSLEGFLAEMLAAANKAEKK